MRWDVYRFKGGVMSISTRQFGDPVPFILVNKFSNIVDFPTPFGPAMIRTELIPEHSAFFITPIFLISNPLMANSTLLERVHVNV